jgi:NADPH-dependent curcumin reductase CurA
MQGGMNRQLILASHPRDKVGAEHFELRAAPIPVPRDGEVLVRTLVLSCDPTQRGWLNGVRTYIPPVQVGDVMPSWSVAQVVDSRRADYAPGDLVWGTFSWQDYAVSDGGGVFPLRKVPRGMPITYPLGVTGITGVTAYLGMCDFARPVPGETVVVSGAAGATGSIAAQLAKICGARVIGIAGGPEKCAWLTEELGLDAAIDYKREDIHGRLRELCPGRVQVYYDNVGGEMLNVLLRAMARHGRVISCGVIAQGHGLEAAEPIRDPGLIMFRSLTLRGFLIFNHMERFDAASDALWSWVREGRLVVREDVIDGLENAPTALRRLFEGANMGKQLVRVAEPDPALSGVR